MTTWRPTTSVSPDSSGRKKSARHRRRPRRWRGKVKRVRSLPVLVQEDQVVVLGDAGEVAVDDGRFEQVLRLEPVEQAAQPRAALGLDEFLVGRSVAGAGLLQAPLALEEGALVQPGRVLLELDALDDAGAPERRRRDRVVDGDVGADVALLGTLVELGRRGGAPDPALLELGQLRAGHAALDADEGVHQAQALEGVAGVADLALVDLVQVLLDVGAGEGGAAEDDRVVGGQAALVELLQVLLHDHGGLDQQAGHADDVGAVLLGGFQDGGDRLLDAEVDDVVAVVGQDDVDEVLADVVDVAADGGQHDGALAARRRTSPCAARGGRRRSS